MPPIPSCKDQLPFIKCLSTVVPTPINLSHMFFFSMKVKKFSETINIYVSSHSHW
jgi:hypothetical protein